MVRPPEGYYSVTEAAALVPCRPVLLLQMCRQGEVPGAIHQRAGRSGRTPWFVPISAITQIQNQCRNRMQWHQGPPCSRCGTPTIRHWNSRGNLDLNCKICGFRVARPVLHIAIEDDDDCAHYNSLSFEERRLLAQQAQEYITRLLRTDARDGNSSEKACVEDVECTS